MQPSTMVHAAYPQEKVLEKGNLVEDTLEGPQKPECVEKVKKEMGKGDSCVDVMARLHFKTMLN